MVQHCTLTPYPGTRLFDRLKDEGRLRFTDFPADWDRYDLTEIMFEPKNLDVDEYGEMMRTIATRLYSRRANIGRFFRSWRDTRRLRTAIWCLMAGRLYKIPKGLDGEPGTKFWYLAPKVLPILDLYRRFEKHF